MGVAINTKCAISRRSQVVLSFLAAIVLGTIAYLLHRQMVLTGSNYHLRRIGLALHAYHDQYRSFPPVVTFGNNHSVSHSWRTLLEPFLAQHGPHGQHFPLYNFAVLWYQQTDTTSPILGTFDYAPYQALAVVGPNAAWTVDRPRTIADFKDGSSNTILLIAVRNTGIKWRQPQDIVVKGASLFIGDQPIDLSADVFVLMADGTANYYAEGLDHNQLASMLTIAGDDIIPIR